MTPCSLHSRPTTIRMRSVDVFENLKCHLTFMHRSKICLNYIRHFIVVNYFQKSNSFAKHDVNIILISSRNKLKRYVNPKRQNYIKENESYGNNITLRQLLHKYVSCS
jgi:hypothetical protein